jgi:hypothetical protein
MKTIKDESKEYGKSNPIIYYNNDSTIDYIDSETPAECFEAGAHNTINNIKQIILDTSPGLKLKAIIEYIKQAQ